MATITRQIEELRKSVEMLSQSLNTRLTRLENQVDELLDEERESPRVEPERAYAPWDHKEDILLRAAMHNLTRLYATRFKRSQRAIMSRIEQSISQGEWVK